MRLRFGAIMLEVVLVAEGAKATTPTGAVALAHCVGGVMLWRVFVLIVTTLLFGCARDGLDFPSVTQTNGAPKNGQARIVVLLEKGYSGVFDSGYPVVLDGEPMGEERQGGHSRIVRRTRRYRGDRGGDLRGKQSGSGRIYPPE